MGTGQVISYMNAVKMHTNNHQQISVAIFTALLFNVAVHMHNNNYCAHNNNYCGHNNY